MKFAFEMGLDAVIYIPSFIKICLGIQKLIREIHRHTTLKSLKPILEVKNYYVVMTSKVF
jgi:hypothetical protein